jgi:hypothetical protein
MLMTVLEGLRAAGVVVEQLETATPELSDQPDAVIRILTEGAETRFAVQERQRAPYPNELPRLALRREALKRVGSALLVVPFVSETLGVALTESGWSWADDQGNFDLRAPGLLLKQRRLASPPKSERKGLPRGAGSFAIIRALISFGAGEEEEANASALASQAKVTQPRASQVLTQLHELQLIERSARGRWRPHREALLDRFLAEYGGPGGSQRYFYSLDPPSEVAARATSFHSPQHPVVVSADVGPDLIVAWRRPSVAVLYTKDDFSVSDLGVVPAQGQHDANVILRAPHDRSVFPTPDFVGTLNDREVYMADPTQMIWDLQDLGGADRLEAAGELREWLLKRP